MNEWAANIIMGWLATVLERVNLQKIKAKVFQNVKFIFWCFAKYYVGSVKFYSECYGVFLTFYAIRQKSSNLYPTYPVSYWPVNKPVTHNTMIASPDYDWVSKTLRTCEMYLVWTKQTKRLLILFTCKNIIAC